MVSLRLNSSFLLLLASSFFANSQISTSIIEHFSSLSDLKEGAWKNPALISERYERPLSTVEGSFNYGERERFGEFHADTYIKRDKLTISAYAQYENGFVRNRRICENADIEAVYPYLTYDTIGGNQNLERYAFGGEVDVKLSDRWRVGGSASYCAGLYYRNRDPRPRTITGDFRLSAGVAFAASSNYDVACAAFYKKYKQSCEISFLSELGSSKIFHLTGLGSHYNRFAGQGLSNYYTGHSWSGSLTLLPRLKGIYCDFYVGSDKLQLILEDLNKLPMSTIRKLNLSFEAGYSDPQKGIILYSNIIKQKGYENIFGDATSSQYPQIASIYMNMISRYEAGVRASGNIRIKCSMLSITPDIRYLRYKEEYRDPHKSLLINSLSCSACFKGIFEIKERILLKASATYTFSNPVGRNRCAIYPSAEELGGFTDILKKGFDTLDSSSQEIKTEIGADLLICKNRYAVGFEAQYHHTVFYGNNVVFAASFKF